MTIYKITEYQDDRGANIICREECDPNGASSRETFLGKGTIVMQTPMGNIPQDIEIPIPASDIFEAFENFEEVMQRDGQKAAEQMRKDMQQQMLEEQSKIVVPK